MRLITVRELSERLGIGIQAIHERKKKGTLGLKGHKNEKLNRWFFEFDEKKWMAEHTLRDKERQELVNLVVDLKKLGKSLNGISERLRHFVRKDFKTEKRIASEVGKVRQKKGYRL